MIKYISAILSVAAVAMAYKETRIVYDDENVNEIGWMPVPEEQATATYNLGMMNNADWMEHIDNFAPLASLAIPGTSNSHYTEFYPVDEELPIWMRTQNWDVPTQLESGIRYLEFELFENGGVLLLKTQGGGEIPLVSLGMDEEEEDSGGSPGSGDSEWRDSVTYMDHGAIGTLANFLEMHNGETIILRIKNKEADPTEAQKQKFRAAFYTHMLERFGFDEQTAYFRGGAIYDPSSLAGGANGNSLLPNMGQARGHILLLLDFHGADGPEFTEYGIPWNSALLHKDRALPVNHLSDMENKWLYINRHLDKAAVAISHIDAGETWGPRGPLYITHLSGGTKNVIPEVVAAGGSRDMSVVPGRIGQRVNVPKGGRSARVKDDKVVVGMNARLSRKLRRPRRNERFGIVVMDFPSAELVGDIIMMNPRR